MGLFDELGKAVGGAVGGAGGPSAGGSQAALLQALMGLLQGGGLQALLQSFQQKGLGDVVASWIGTGANLPISAEQVTQVLGHDTLARLAGQAGLDPKAAAGQLSSILPGLVDRLSPGGTLPDAGALQGALSGALSGGLGDALKKLF
jgi:uncharacterized protein YidB (DUF937 family)